MCSKPYQKMDRYVLVCLKKNMNFKDLDLIPELLAVLKEQNYIKPTPIQEQSIPHLLNGRDLFGSAQTGTGKTAAFCMPLLQMLYQNKRKRSRNPRALILAPTRELAIQINESLNIYGSRLPVKNAVIYGGVSQKPQEQVIKNGLDILIATPGRLLDLMNQKKVFLSNVEFLVLDEADQMLDMGFIRDIRKILKEVPENRQTLLFSATLPDEIRSLVEKTLKDPLHVELNKKENASARTIKQNLYYVDKADKRDLIKLIFQENEL